VKELRQILATDVFGKIRFIDVLMRFWNQKVKIQGHSRRKHNHQWQPIKFHLVSFDVMRYPQLTTFESSNAWTRL